MIEILIKNPEILTDSQIEAHRTRQNELNARYKQISSEATWSLAYPFTNENLIGNIGLTPLLMGKKIAGICGGGDFPITAVMAGARLVDAVDHSLPICCFAELKIAALTCLERERFGTADYLLPKVYREIRDMLSDQTQIFFDGGGHLMINNI